MFLLRKKKLQDLLHMFLMEMQLENLLYVVLQCLKISLFDILIDSSLRVFY